MNLYQSLLSARIHKTEKLYKTPPRRGRRSQRGKETGIGTLLALTAVLSVLFTDRLPAKDARELADRAGKYICQVANTQNKKAPAVFPFTNENDELTGVDTPVSGAADKTSLQIRIVDPTTGEIPGTTREESKTAPGSGAINAGDKIEPAKTITIKKVSPTLENHYPRQTKRLTRKIRKQPAQRGQKKRRYR